MTQRLHTPEFVKLRELLDQNQFELTDFDCENIDAERRDYSLIYLMNDAVESFLIFKNAKCTGYFDAESEENFVYSLYMEEDRFVLKVEQEKHHFLMFFDDLEMKMHLYNYSEIGHFWVKKYEYLRILEYQIAIMRDKLDYLGIEACNKQEQQLAILKEFPPLNYTCYPSASMQYIFPMENPWELSDEAADLMIGIAETVRDISFVRILKRYKQKPSVKMAKYVAVCLRRMKHQTVVEELKRRISEAARVYPDRVFGNEVDDKKKVLLDKAEILQRKLKEKGVYAEIYREEPFIYDCDSICLQVRLLIHKRCFLNRKVEIQTII